jgi:hypothetical protein
MEELMQRVLFVMLMDVIGVIANIVSTTIMVVLTVTCIFPVTGYFVWDAVLGQWWAGCYLVIWVVAVIGLKLFDWVGSCVERAGYE